MLRCACSDVGHHCSQELLHWKRFSVRPKYPKCNPQLSWSSIIINCLPQDKLRNTCTEIIIPIIGIHAHSSNSPHDIIWDVRPTVDQDARLKKSAIHPSYHDAYEEKVSACFLITKIYHGNRSTNNQKALQNLAVPTMWPMYAAVIEMEIRKKAHQEKYTVDKLSRCVFIYWRTQWKQEEHSASISISWFDRLNKCKHSCEMWKVTYHWDQPVTWPESAAEICGTQN